MRRRSRQGVVEGAEGTGIAHLTQPAATCSKNLRWPDGVACPRCGSLGLSTIKGRRVYDCNDCRYQFSVTAGTIMHDSHLPLRKWFVAIYLMCESKKGVSALQLHRTLGVARRTAWYLSHHSRAAMANDPLEGPTLVGVVEVDETLVGGKAPGKGHGYRGNKFLGCGRDPVRRECATREGAKRPAHDPPRLHQPHRARRGRGHLHRRTQVLPRHRGRRHPARDGQPLPRRMGRGRRAHELHRGRGRSSSAPSWEASTR